MNNADPAASLVPDVHLSSLQGRTVLVRSTTDRRDPPTALRGTIEVHNHQAGTEAPRIGIALEFPQMFMSHAHHRVIPLSPADVARLLASERNGALEFTIDGELG